MIPRTDHVLDHVDDYLHDLLDSADADYVARHCAECPACGAALEDARRRLAALQTVPPTEASEELVRATVAGVAEHEQRRRRRRRHVLGSLLGAAAAAAAIIAGFHLHYENLSASPTDLKVLGQTQLLAGAAASLRVCLIDHRSGAALSGVPVRVGLRHKGTGEVVELANFTTDAEGTGNPRFQVPDWADADCELQVTTDNPAHESLAYPIKVHRSRQVMLSSDKPVYQPGETIHVRSLALRRPDLHPVAGEDATFTVTDAKGNVIFKHTMKNSEYGIAFADCRLATEIIEGPYVIGCAVGDTPSRLGVEVKKYVLPKFKVGVTLDRPYYAPGQKVTATVEAGYFFGKPVAGGVEVEARAAGQEKPLYQGSAKTDENGKAVFSFDLPKELSGLREGGEVPVTLRATVTDGAGQKQAKEALTVVTTSPLKIEVFPEGGTLIAGIKTTVYVFASYADGRPAKATVEGPDGIKVATNELGVGSFDYTAPVGRPLDGTFRVSDGQGVTAEKQVALAYSAGYSDFLLQTDKAVYDGGDTLNLSAFSQDEAPVFVDVIKDGQTLLTATVAMGRGKGACALDLPAELSGTMQLCAYRLSPTGTPIRKTRTLYVRPAKSLQIKATTDQAEYRPGRRAKVSFELLDKAGKPARGALSLAAVDEAVFSVLEQAPGSEGRVFGVDAELLRPVQALYRWSPDATANLPPAERDRFEQALFARTVQTSSGAEPVRRGWSKRVVDDFGEPGMSAGPEHTLAASSFAAESQRVEQARARGLKRVETAWMLLGGSLLLLGYVLMWVYVRPLSVVALLHGVGIVFLCGLCIMNIELGGTGIRSEIAQMSVGVVNMADVMNESAKGFSHGSRKEGGESGAEPARVRQHFPETLLWRPQLITDDDGRASLDIDLADSITTWRLTASAVAADGRLGATQAGIKVFQPFFVDLNLPVALTRGDEVAVPVVVHNHLDRPQTVELTLAAGDWFERLDAAARKIELPPRAVRSASYRVRVKAVGRHALQVTAKGGDLADAIRRDIEVVPDGRQVEQVVNGSLAQPADVTLTVHENAVAGSAKVLVKIYPSSFSQLVEGLDGIFQRPYGCFEQTSSTTYPNVLALEYLRQTKKTAPEVEAKAKQYIHLGYQRLLGFEVPDGGFDWFGRPPANRTLTAYGLMEFQDMAKVYAVDPQLIERTRAWLLRQRAADGSWASESHAMHDDPARGRRDETAKLSATAYVAWAVFGGPGASSHADVTRRYLLSHKPDSLGDPYVLALVANALNALDAEGRDALPYIDRLEALKKSSNEGKLVFWEQPADARTAFYGAGRGGAVETTALAALALLHRNQGPETTRRALAWLVKQKGAGGTWPSTQATVLALKALVAGTGKPAGDGERRVALVWNGRKQEIVIPADQAEVMKQIDLSEGLKPGTHRLTLTETSATAAGYQVEFRYHVPDAGRPEKPEPLRVELTYDRTELRVDEAVKATARVTNTMTQAAPMVILDLPVPAGFAIDGEDFAELVKGKKVEKYQVGARSVVLYLRGLGAGQSLEVKYGMRATMPVKVSVPPARAYEYYDADKQGTSAPVTMTVAGR